MARTPAAHRLVTLPCSSTRHRISGLLATMMQPRACRKHGVCMHGMLIRSTTGKWGRRARGARASEMQPRGCGGSRKRGSRHGSHRALDELQEVKAVMTNHVP